MLRLVEEIGGGGFAGKSIRTLHRAIPAATHTQPPPNQLFTGSSLLTHVPHNPFPPGQFEGQFEDGA